MKILIVLPDRQVGGGQIAALRLAGALAKRHEVSVVYARPELADAEPPVVPPGVRELPSVPGHISHFLPKWLWLLVVIADFLLPPWGRGRESGTLVTALNRGQESKRRLHLSNLISSVGFDIINSHTWRADLFVGQTLATVPGAKWVITMHGCYEFLLRYMRRHPEYEQQIRQVLNRADLVLYTSQKNLEVMGRISNIWLQTPPRQIYNGIDVDLARDSKQVLLDWPPADLKLVLVSRAIPEKGWEKAIQAVLEINSTTKYRVCLALLGESAWQKKLARSYQHQEIIFFGHVSDPMSVIRQCDVGLLPTWFASESYPATVLEYLVCGKPVIATNIGEIREMISADGKAAGQLLEISADGKVETKSLVADILRYLEDHALLETHGALAIKASQKFSMSENAEAYESIFTGLLQENGPGATQSVSK